MAYPIKCPHDPFHEVEHLGQRTDSDTWRCLSEQCAAFLFQVPPEKPGCPECASDDTALTASGGHRETAVANAMGVNALDPPVDPSTLPHAILEGIWWQKWRCGQCGHVWTESYP